MVAVIETSWQDILDGKPLPESPARTAFREAVAEIADKAKQTLPNCTGRVESAVKLVLAGDVELLPDGKAKVASQSNGTTKYFIVNGECSCPDYSRAPSNWCKHRIAAGLAKRARTLTKAKLEQLVSANNGTTQPATDQPLSETVITPVHALVESKPIAVPLPLPEAKASANVFVTIAGRKVQLTLRDHDEDSLLSRMEKLLSRFPSAEEPEPESAPTPPENWCPIHHVQMKRYSNDKGSWYSHRTSAGTWCNGKRNGK
jgi:hypothetical protein